MPSKPAAILSVLVLAAFCACGAPPKPRAPLTLFVRPWLEPIYQEDTIADGEAGAAVELAATPGESEPASLGVLAGVTLRGGRWRVSDLAGAGGAVIPASAVGIRATRYIDPGTVDSFRRWDRPGGHRLLPAYLDPGTAPDIAAGAAQQYWLTVRVPDDAIPGAYAGTLTYQAVGALPATLPLKLHVYGFRLPEARPAYFLAGDNWPLDPASFADSRAHGMNTICVNQGHPKVAGVYANRTWSFPGLVDNVEKVIRTAQQAGLAKDHPIGLMMYQHLIRGAVAGLSQAGIQRPDSETDTFDDRADYWLFFGKGEPVELHQRFRGAYYPTADPYARPTTPYGAALYDGWVAAMKQLEAAGAQRGWPRLFYWLTDEPHVNRGRMRSALVMARAAKEAGALGMVTCNEPTVSEPDPAKQWYGAVGGEPALLFGDLLGVRCYNNAYLGDETEQRTRAAKALYGTYVNVYGNQPAAVRYQSGLLAWRLGLDVVMMWAWGPAGTDVGGTRAWLRDWEAAREGIDDLKYVEALERAIQSGRGTSQARAAAEQTLAEVREAVVPDPRAIGFVDSFTGQLVRALKGRKRFPAERFDALRHDVARAIEALGPVSGP